ncbi:lantibiotic dehydratase [Streptomyces actuosus]|uniref:Lantibiotic dehydratase n=1 Tax=Streptomyces actuosus TaxID=1885 RepID=A0ABS2VJR0_STRAS|nr:lantibiotic dehydratase [Streptomyces actuosus]MBN0043325.1 lantibiotic dehydratase [Streptomyces actuosus]
MSRQGFGFAGYGVVRVCSQPLDAVARLSSPEVARLCDELERLRRDWAERAPRVAEELTALVPALDDRDRRRTVLALRRRLHRALEVPEDEFTTPDAAVPGAAELRRLAARRTELTARLAAEYETALAGERKALAAAALDPALRAGAQLSADGLVRNMDRYAAAVADGTAHGKRERMTESTVLNLLTRSALKPSPFGRLVHTRPVLLEPTADIAASAATAGGADATGAGDGVPVSVCRLPRQLVSWVERCLAETPGLRPAAVVRRAPVVAASAEGAVFLVRGRDGSREPASRERFVRVPAGPVVTALLAFPADEAVPEREVRERCAAPPGTAPQAAAAELDALFEQGVLARDLGVGDQHPHPVARLAELLPEYTDHTDPGPADCVRGLAAAETAFATADVERREHLVARITGHVGDLAAHCGVDVPPVDTARTLVYEDAVVSRPRREEPARWRRHLPDLEPWHRMLPAFDDGAHVRAVVADVVRDRFGPGPHRLLTLFAALSSPKLQPLLTERLTDLSADVPRQLRGLQDTVFELAAGDGEAVVDPRRVARLAGQLPPWVPRWSRVSWNVQHHPSPDGELLVVNGGSIGFGRAVSRFLPAYEAAGDDGFGDLVTADIARHDDARAPLTDLSAVLGINANVHPPLLGSHLRYPCAAPGPWGGGTGISLEDCWVAHDEDSGRLLLRHGRDGHELRLVMLNFLLNELAPRFYQFLGFFGSGSLANLAWWDRVDQRRVARRPADRDTVRRYPRVRSGSLVLARRTWKVPARLLPDVAGRTGVGLVREVRRWREELGLPERVFHRGFTLPDPLVPVSAEERHSWARTLARFPTSAERKPTFLDFTSVTGLLAWQRALRRCEGDITFQECLPVPDLDHPQPLDGRAATGGPAGDGGPFTEEFIVETTEGAP